MNLPKHIRTRRQGFTLIELLVVIAIIAILVGLISAAVVKALGKGTEVTNMAQIRQMAAAVQAFQTQFKADHIPSRIVLCKYRAHYNMSNPLHRDSLAYLNQVWPRLEWVVPNSSPPIYNRIDWDGIEGGGGPPTSQAPRETRDNAFTLDGGQCLVFFLGGIPITGANPGIGGFSTNPVNPTAFTSERVSPFYEFKSNRLLLVPNQRFFHYTDAYANASDSTRRAYAYFSSYKRNNYNKYFSTARGSDCFVAAAYGGVTPWPLAEQIAGSARYPNPDSFQIISAGSNQAFGSGTVLPAGTPLWTYRDPGQAYAGVAPGSDDQSNFHSLLLGVPAE